MTIGVAVRVCPIHHDVVLGIQYFAIRCVVASNKLSRCGREMNSLRTTRVHMWILLTSHIHPFASNTIKVASSIRALVRIGLDRGWRSWAW